MRDPSPHAGKTVRIRVDAAELGGHDITVVDWYERTHGGKSWRDQLDVDPRAQGYAVRRGLGGLPEDDDVLFGRVDGMGQLIHVSELEGVAPDATPGRYGPKPVDGRAVGRPCPACSTPLAEGDTVAVIPIGPGADSAARHNAREGRTYEAVVIELHWACATGDESYTTEG